MIGQYPGQVVSTVCALFAPPILLFGLYVIAHGHYGPGGGFAGGVALAVAIIMVRVTQAEATSERVFPPAAAVVTASVGMVVFLLTGLLPMVFDGAFLDYAAVPAEVAASRLRYLGILVVEIGVGLAVFGAMVLVFDVLAERLR